jgi:glycosyltransferase involved in cell wall biosynthesis
VRFLLFGTYDEGRHPRVRVVREGLAAHGHAVEILNRPLGDTTAERVGVARRPLAALAWGGRLLVAWAQLIAGSRRVRRPDVILVGYLGVFDVLLARLRWPRAVIVLDHLAPLAATAEDRSMKGLGRRLMELADRLACRCASLVMYDTVENATPSPKSVVVPVGADARWYRERPDAGDTPLRAVFFGLFTPLQGAPVVGEAIRRLAGSGIDVTLVGAGQDAEATRASLGSTEGDIGWVPWVEPDALPALVAAHHVCLGIFGTTPKAAAVVPNKVYQGMASGCVVITADTPPQRRALDDAAIFVPPGDAAALAAALAALAADPDRRREFQDRSLARAAAFRPEEVVKPLIRRLAGEGDGAGRAEPAPPA